MRIYIGKKSKSIPSPEENYFVHFALRLPVAKDVITKSCSYLHNLVVLFSPYPGSKDRISRVKIDIENSDICKFQVHDTMSINKIQKPPESKFVLVIKSS